MPNRSSKLKRPRDSNQLARLLTGIATGEVQDQKTDDGKDPAAVALGRKGGNATAAKLSHKKRTEIAKKTATAQWTKLHKQ